MAESEQVEWNGTRYYRYPESRHKAHRDYFHSSKGTLLHRDMWTWAYGPIPAGHHIHHVDRDTGHNDLDNFACVLGWQHLKEHVGAWPRFEHTCSWCGRTYATVRRIRTKFCSGACKAAERRASGLDDEDRICVGCGTTFRIGKYLRGDYCSISCSACHRARTATGAFAGL
jgi:hypothetical protein